MEQQDLSLEQKLDILKFILQDQRGEMQYRREREYRIFTWSSSLLLALIGALLITKQSEAVIWRPYGSWGSLVASAAVILIVMYTTTWHFRNNRFRGQNAQVISRIGWLLHCFDEGYFDPRGAALFPGEWSAYGRREETASRPRRVMGRLLGANYISATVLLGLLALIMIWLPQ